MLEASCSHRGLSHNVVSAKDSSRSDNNIHIRRMQAQRRVSKKVNSISPLNHNQNHTLSTTQNKLKNKP